MTWSPDSWHGKPIKQQPSYRDENAVAAALARVRELPPLVAHGEVDALRTRLARASRGEAFCSKVVIARSASLIAAKSRLRRS